MNLTYSYGQPSLSELQQDTQGHGDLTSSSILGINYFERMDMNSAITQFHSQPSFSHSQQNTEDQNYWTFSFNPGLDCSEPMYVTGTFTHLHCQPSFRQSNSKQDTEGDDHLTAFFNDYMSQFGFKRMQNGRYAIQLGLYFCGTIPLRTVNKPSLAVVWGSVNGYMAPSYERSQLACGCQRCRSVQLGGTADSALGGKSLQRPIRSTITSFTISDGRIYITACQTQPSL